MKLYTYDYDRTYAPAMPVVEVRLIGPESNRTVGPVTALVDSGADATAVPLSLLVQIRAFSIGSGSMSGIWGDRRPVKIYLVSLEIGEYQLLGIRAAAVPDEFGMVLGRNVLNHLELRLNGPANVVEIPRQ
jgi:hypothetical protein